MIRALTILIFIITPTATIAGWLLGNPLIGLLLLVLIPLLGVGSVVLKLRRDLQFRSRLSQPASNPAGL
jgi:hypothetical protein